ncbi:MAG: hypothetical protein IT182_17985 [Acidobacteria bacterium]|nr:hypothetical protein [Acidobacteriota bacterium]
MSNARNGWILVVALAAASSYAQNPPTAVEVWVEDHPRPLYEAVRQIERRFGYVVTYEDVPYVYGKNIVDVTESVARSAPATGRVLEQRHGSLVVTYTPHSRSTAGQVGEVLEATVAQMNLSGEFAQFRVDTSHGAYHVVPVARPGRDGVTEPYMAPLDAMMSAQIPERPLFEVMTRLLDGINAASGKEIRPGMIPTRGGWTAVDATSERARDIVHRTIRSVSSDLSWSVLCGVGQNDLCALNIHRVKSPEQP